jgi:hypothetical protein
MREPERFVAVNPQISLAALHHRMIVVGQDARGRLIHVDATQRGKCRCLACDDSKWKQGINSGVDLECIRP